MKKILAILLTLAVVFTVGAFSVNAADGDVAAIGAETYATLQSAINASVPGDTVTLIDDVAESVTINKSITLDGDNHKYTGQITLNKVKAVIQNINFVDSYIYKNKKTGASGLDITVKNCAFEGSLNEGYAMRIDGSSNILIENCSAKDVNFGFLYINSSSDKIALKNVSIDGANYAIHIVYNNFTVLENVTIKNATYGIVNQTHGSKTITFKNCDVEATYPVYVWEKSATEQNFIFKGENDFGTDDLTFGSSLVTATVDFARLGDETFTSLQAAIDACVPGDNTIELLRNCGETVTVKQTEGVNIVIDGKGKVYSGTIKVDGNNRPFGAESLTIKNVNFENTEKTNYAYFIDATTNSKGGNSESHNLTVEDCAFKSNNWHYSIATRHPYNLTVKNCTADRVYYLIYNPQGGQKITVEDCTVTNATYGIGSQKCLETNIKNYTYTGMAAGIYGRSSINSSVITMENVNITTTYNGQSAITLWKNNDSGTSKTFRFVLIGKNNSFTAPEGVDWFARQSETNSPYEFINIYDVAAIGDKTYTSLKAAIADAEDGDVITVIDDFALSCSDAGEKVSGMYPLVAVVDKKVTVDLNGKTITADVSLDANMLAVFYAGGTGELTLTDSSEDKCGTVDVTMADGTKAYSMFTVLGTDGAKMYIEGGNYTIDKVDYGQSMLYAGQNNQMFVSGGNFVLGNAKTRDPGNGEMQPWMFNAHGDGVKFIVVTGGTYNTDPTHYHGEASFPGCYAPVEKEGFWEIEIVHTPGDAATCQAPQICTVCKTELDAIKEHEAGEYVSNNDATCTADGTKTAECIYGCGKTYTVADPGTIKPHTPGDAATCQAPQICTVCKTELDAIKEHKLGEYVSNNDATCTHDGTKTATCIYGCGFSDTVTDKGTMGEHNDVDGSGNCDGCHKKCCEICGGFHKDMIADIICLLGELVRLIIVFIATVF